MAIPHLILVLLQSTACYWLQYRPSDWTTEEKSWYVCLFRTSIILLYSWGTVLTTDSRRLFVCVEIYLCSVCHGAENTVCTPGCELLIVRWFQLAALRDPFMDPLSCWRRTKQLINWPCQWGSIRWKPTLTHISLSEYLNICFQRCNTY